MQCSVDPRVVVGKLSVDTCAGADLFFRETFNGNGRPCGTYHRVDRNLTIDPAFITTLEARDPRSNFALRSVPYSLSMSKSITNPPSTPNPWADRTGVVRGWCAEQQCAAGLPDRRDRLTFAMQAMQAAQLRRPASART